MSIKHYGETVHEESVSKTLKCREIVQEILRFGVDQTQIIKIIELLSLEIENRDLMSAISDVVKNSRNTDSATKIIS